MDALFRAIYVAVVKKRNGKNNDFRTWFGHAAARVAQWMGSPIAFVIAVATVVAWALLGRHFHYSDTWQLVINTGTTIVTFLMVFLIQNTQNRDARAIHLKLDEVIRAISSADNSMIDVESLSDEELLALMKSYEKLRSEYQSRTEPSESRKRA